MRALLAATALVVCCSTAAALRRTLEEALDSPGALAETARGIAEKPEPSAAHKLHIGSVVRWTDSLSLEVMEVAGIGSRGTTVFKARVLDCPGAVNAEVAIKELVFSAKERRIDKSLHKKVNREATIMTAIKGPGIVRYFDRRYHKGVGWIAMQYAPVDLLTFVNRRFHCPSRSLIDRFLFMCTGPPGLSSFLVARLLYDVLLAVYLMHSAGFVHTDIKPENIMVLCPSGKEESDCHALLIDFDVACRFTGRGANHCGEFEGTKRFISPEWLGLALNEHGGKVPRDPTKQDMWAIGMVLHSMLFGTLPRKPSVQEGADAYRRDLMSSLQPLIGAPNIEFARLLFGLLDPEPSTRWSAGRALSVLGVAFPKAVHAANASAAGLQALEECFHRRPR